MGAHIRRSEYLRTRYALRKKTGWREALPATPHGAPSWPRGWRGSISHKDGHVAFAVAEDTSFVSLGIDVESCVKVRSGLESRILDAEESRFLNAYQGIFDREHLLAMVFSFKESIFKCHFPLGLKMFYFHDATIEDIDFSQLMMRARLKVDTSPITKAGSLIEGFVSYKEEMGKKYVITSVSLRA